MDSDPPCLCASQRKKAKKEVEDGGVCCFTCIKGATY